MWLTLALLAPTVTAGCSAADRELGGGPTSATTAGMTPGTGDTGGSSQGGGTGDDDDSNPTSPTAATTRGDEAGSSDESGLDPSGETTCDPDCVGRDCGDDGCGGTCGDCGDGFSCLPAGLCIEGDLPPSGCREAGPQFPSTVNISQTIVIDEPGDYDFEGVLHVWTGGGDCIQQENDPYVLRIAASNVTLRNFAYQNAGDGIHIGTSNDGQGHSSGSPISNIVLENVTGWACEDALTVQKGVQDITIRDSLFLPNPNPDERDKLLQLNFGDVTIERTTFWGGGENGTGTCLMFKGGQDVTIRDSCFMDCDRAINGSTRNGIVGDISTDHSELLSVGNEGHFSSRADTFWDPWKMFTAEGDVHATSRDDSLFDNPADDFEFGASIDYE